MDYEEKRKDLIKKGANREISEEELRRELTKLESTRRKKILDYYLVEDELKYEDALIYYLFYYAIIKNGRLRFPDLPSDIALVNFSKRMDFNIVWELF